MKELLTAYSMPLICEKEHDQNQDGQTSTTEDGRFARAKRNAGDIYYIIDWERALQDDQSKHREVHEQQLSHFSTSKNSRRCR